MGGSRFDAHGPGGAGNDAALHRGMRALAIVFLRPCRQKVAAPRRREAGRAACVSCRDALRCREVDEAMSGRMLRFLLVVLDGFLGLTAIAGGLGFLPGSTPRRLPTTQAPYSPT